MNPFIKKPVAIYDVEDKKLVLIGANVQTSYEYLTDVRRTVHENSIARSIRDKAVIHKNVFKRRLTAREASIEQTKLLGEKAAVVILDSRYINPVYCGNHKVSEVTNKSTETFKR